MNPARKTLFTGGGGLLGRAMRELAPHLLYPTSAEFDVRDRAGMDAYLGGLGVQAIVHAAALTSPPRVDADPATALDVNIVGTANLVKLCLSRGLRLIYISTDYVFRGDRGNYREDDPVLPINRYAWSKLGGECAASLYDRALIVRTSFGPTPFPHPKAFVDQWTSRQTAPAIAAKLLPLVDSDLVGVIHLGGRRRTVREYALEDADGREVGELSLRDVSFAAPRDTSLDCGRYEAIFGAGT